jgi:pyruvyltransferase
MANRTRSNRLWQIGKYFFADPLRQAIFSLTNHDKLPLSWFLSQNWGDALNPLLVEMLSGKRVVAVPGHYCDHFLVVGSILGTSNRNSQVWGSGFIKDGDSVTESPKMIHAIRGPLSREALLSAGIPCPEVYGDPALLFPLFFDPQVRKEYEFGIVAHYVDKEHPWVDAHRNRPDVLIIDIEGDTWQFVRDIKSCKAVFSSSLHGLICADAYGVPNVWIQMSDEVIGGDFKFRDYRLSIGADEAFPIIVRPGDMVDSIAHEVARHELKIDLRKLLLACPFISPQIRAFVEDSVGDPPLHGQVLRQFVSQDLSGCNDSISKT